MLKALDSFVRSFYREIKDQNYTIYEFLLTKAHYKIIKCFKELWFIFN